MGLVNLSPDIEELWNEWQIRSLMLIGVLLQIILTILGERRKYTVGLGDFLWLAYLSADSVAIFSLGILARSVANSTNPNLIPVFWAPILLVHIGGPGTISAYSMHELDKLLINHLLQLVTRVGVVGYVLFRLRENAFILVAIPIFISGMIKYGERIWVLKRNKESNNLSQQPSAKKACIQIEDTFPFTESLREVRYLHEARLLFNTSKMLFQNLDLVNFDQEITYDLVSEKKAEEAFQLTEIELGLKKPKRWSRLMGQHNLISALSKKPVNKLRKKYFPGTWNIHSRVDVDKDLKELIFKQVKYKRSRYDPDTNDFPVLLKLLEERGREALQSKDCIGKFGWSVDRVEFSHSLLTWHIATHVCYIDDSRKNGFAKDQNCAMSTSLSNYMLYLMVQCPNMLATELSGTRYTDTRIHLHRLLFIRNTHKEADKKLSMDKLDTLSFPKDQVKAFFYELLRRPSTMLGEIEEQQEEKSALLDGCMLAMSLQSSETQDGWPNEKKWEMISEVWVEMLMYAASHCGWKEHADALGRGGELLTHVCILMAHLGLSKQCPPEVSKQLAGQSKRLRDFTARIVSENEDFINLHLNHSITAKSNHSIILKEWDLFAVDFDALSDAVEVKHHPLYSGGGTEVIGSVNGLVFLRRSETNIAVYNLSTRECKKCYVAETEIPRRDLTTGYVYYGFGYDSYGDDYKVVRMAQFVREDGSGDGGGGGGGGFGCEYEVKVYRLKNDKWKKIEGLPIRLRLLSKPFFHILNRRGYGVFAGHALHWIVPQRRQLGIRDCVLGFDIRDDKFFELPQPDYENKGMNFQVDVGVLEGNLCVMCNYEHVCVDVWVMKEYGVKESWCMMFSVQGIKWISAFMFLRPLVYSKDGDKVLLEVNGEKLFWYDWKNKHAKVVRVRGGPSSFGSEMYVESLIRINDGDPIGWKKQQELDEEVEERKTDRNKSMLPTYAICCWDLNFEFGCQVNEKSYLMSVVSLRDDFLSVGFKLKLYSCSSYSILPRADTGVMIHSSLKTENGEKNPSY
ncbi:F-box protein CPR30-like isoform X1 [Populus alba x Populus x berolinensis]|uniref:F-box protein CPR30-like isoform X1 n=1 Tax=Populus alba x Populus x berolinensis TaxID=444605 RepID=A0AAD6QKB1_9ROSI|nr:F-box protein CPR30-like isoform X1 [Populus alba x Populus x berolinensis]